MPELENKLTAPEGCAPLPCSAGFFWWRATAEKPWRMVQIVDFRPEGEPYLCAYDVELKEWGGRTLKVWAEMHPPGQWIDVRKPETMEELEARQLREHVCAMHRDMTGKCFVCGSSSLPNVPTLAHADKNHE